MTRGSSSDEQIAAKRQELALERDMEECRKLCDDFDRAAYQLVRHHGATLEGLREQLEEVVKDA